MIEFKKQKEIFSSRKKIIIIAVVAIFLISYGAFSFFMSQALNGSVILPSLYQTYQTPEALWDEALPGDLVKLELYSPSNPAEVTSTSNSLLLANSTSDIVFIANTKKDNKSIRSETERTTAYFKLIRKSTEKFNGLEKRVIYIELYKFAELIL